MLCTTCIYSKAERTGPHETVSWCEWHQVGYPLRTECPHYAVEANPPNWPLDDDDWEWARLGDSGFDVTQ